MANEIDNMITDKKDRLAASSFAVAESAADVSGSFNDKSITFNGSLINYDYYTILRDKQTNINKFYELADFFVDAEELIGGALYQVYIPFSLTDGWYLTGSDERTKDKYYEWFERIHLNEKLDSWFYQYYLFANVYFSLMEDSDIVTLPPHLCRISNVLVNGNPLIEFNARSVKQDFKKQGQKALKKYLDDDELDIRIAGYPKEVTEALKTNKEFVQLDPKTTFVLQGSKPEWQRYAIPMIARCLLPLGQKALITEYIDSLMTLAASSFVHGAVSSPEGSQVIVDTPILQSVLNVTKSAMKAGNGVAITNSGVKYSIIQPDLDKVFEQDPYSMVNENILGGLGINNSVTAGTDSAVSFGSSQISTKIISLRITAARQAMCKLMNRIIRAVNGSPYGLPRSNTSRLPTFEMPTSDLTQVAAFQSACMKLWESGVLSTRTLLENYHIDIETEFERKKKEIADGKAEIFVAPGKNTSGNSDNSNGDGDGEIGRPRLDDSERSSDEGNARTGAQPKPSNPEGSEPQE